MLKQNVTPDLRFVAAVFADECVNHGPPLKERLNTGLGTA